jgi:hypothetical protein
MPPPKPDPIKFCEVCGVQLERKRYNGRLEDRGVFLRRRRCGQSCANTKLTDLTPDGYRWRARKHRKDACESCGATANLHVHHDDRNPANNDPANLRTLCHSCHLRLHWREDREKRLAAMKRPPIPPVICAVCNGEFWPRRRRIQTCSPGCKSALLSRRTTEHYATTAAPGPAPGVGAALTA